MKKKIKPQKNQCMWFALCDKKAVTTVSHPILGEVPICQRCLDRLNRQIGEI